jgi:HD-GYP domain-containing protein (c-di-GMP phosphodiesterase class II)
MDVQRTDGAGKPYIAIAFGNAAQRSKAASSLMSFYRFAEYQDIPRAIAGFRASPPLVALVGEELPVAGGYEFVQMLRLDDRLAAVPVVMLVARDNKHTRDAVQQCGAQSYLVDPYSRSVLITTISDLLNRAVERRWKLLPSLQRQALTGTLELFNGISNVISNGEPIPYGAVRDACKPLVEAVAKDDFKSILNGVRDHDNYSYAHSVRVATFLALFGFNLRLPKAEQIVLASGGLLHDVGKMAIPHEVLNKPGRLNGSEFAVMKGHVSASVRYLQGCHDMPRGILTIAGQHHEKLDGSGYPLGLKGNQLDRLARMASIIDVFSALTDRRVYKPPMDAETALKIMVDEMGSHLDMTLLGLFRQMLLDGARVTSPTPSPAVS